MSLPKFSKDESNDIPPVDIEAWGAPDLPPEATTPPPFPSPYWKTYWFDPDRNMSASSPPPTRSFTFPTVAFVVPAPVPAPPPMPPTSLYLPDPPNSPYGAEVRLDRKESTSTGNELHSASEPISPSAVKPSIELPSGFSCEKREAAFLNSPKRLMSSSLNDVVKSCPYALARRLEPLRADNNVGDPCCINPPSKSDSLPMSPISPDPKMLLLGCAFCGAPASPGPPPSSLTFRWP
mmetsp:Transcript_94934/g.230732  ORF Transcript_94934/g.230732 Transcript_94934/m.230732 type:complete len:236 (-) Transcript_94934:326-1033(-)